jgi:hypothetical protein
MTIFRKHTSSSASLPVEDTGNVTDKVDRIRSGTTWLKARRTGNIRRKEVKTDRPELDTEKVSHM